MLLSLFVLIFAAISFSPVTAQEFNTEAETSYVNFLDVIENPELYPNIEITVHETINDYIEAVSNDAIVDASDKEKLINDAKKTLMTRSSNSYGYLTFTFTTTVTASYKVKPYFYTKVEYCGASNPCSLTSIQYGNIDRNYNGSSYGFDGTLYYNLENYKTIFFDLNGNFYKNASTTESIAGTVGIGGVATSSFSSSNTSNFYAYKHDSQRQIINGIQ